MGEREGKWRKGMGKEEVDGEGRGGDSVETDTATGQV